MGHPNLPLEGRFLAAVKACGGGAVLSHRSACALWGIRDWEERVVEVTIFGAGPRKHNGIRAHRSRWRERKDFRIHQGIPVTAPARTLLDSIPCLGPVGARRAVRRAQSLNLVNVRQLVDLLTRAGARRGVRTLARLVADGPAPTRSELEDVVSDLLAAGGLERPDVNKPMRIAGRRVVPDFRWPAAHLIVEADGAAWHDNPIAREDDRERQALLEAHGERVLRVSWTQAIARGPETLARIRRAGAPPLE